MGDVNCGETVQPPGNEINFAAVSQNCRISKNAGCGKRVGWGWGVGGDDFRKSWVTVGKLLRVTRWCTRVLRGCEKLTNKYKRVRRRSRPRRASRKSTDWSDRRPVCSPTKRTAKNCDVRLERVEIVREWSYDVHVHRCSTENFSGRRFTVK